MNGETTSPPCAVTIHTDGACLGNPGPGGYGVVMDFGERKQELSAGYRLTTNNRMELLAVIEAPARPVRPVHRDPDHGFALRPRCHRKALAGRLAEEGLGQRGQAAGEESGPVAVAAAPAGGPYGAFSWVRGHTGNPDNERCDALAGAAARKRGLPDDPGYPG